MGDFEVKNKKNINFLLKFEKKTIQICKHGVSLCILGDKHHNFDKKKEI